MHAAPVVPDQPKPKPSHIRSRWAIGMTSGAAHPGCARGTGVEVCFELGDERTEVKARCIDGAVAWR